jgi:uncharacterized membrane protein YkvA (DUF1232 family)
MNWQEWKRRARQLSSQTYTLYLAYRHPRTPWYAKAFAALIVGYVFSPIDPIPDFIPGVGLLDEMVVVPIGILIAAKMIPPDVFTECREQAREVEEGEKPVSRVAAVVVVAIWLRGRNLATVRRTGRRLGVGDLLRPQLLRKAPSTTLGGYAPVCRHPIP